jgi:hypothetical protein
MVGLFWNIRGLGKTGRFPTLVDRIKSTHADFVGITETKKGVFYSRLFKVFDWSDNF